MSTTRPGIMLVTDWIKEHKVNQASVYKWVSETHAKQKWLKIGRMYVVDQRMAEALKQEFLVRKSDPPPSAAGRPTNGQLDRHAVDDLRRDVLSSIAPLQKQLNAIGMALQGMDERLAVVSRDVARLMAEFGVKHPDTSPTQTRKV